MTGGTFFRRRLVEQNRFALNHPAQLVTAGAAHVLMRASQCEVRALVVIKQRRFPLHAVVTLGAARNSGLCELVRMHVLMAVLTLHRSRFEIDIQQVRFKIWRLVAVDARRSAVRTQQREFRLRVIESGELPPTLGGVAGLAPSMSAVSADSLHAFLELPLMRIVMATRAVQVAPVIDNGGLGLELRRFLVAVGTGNGDVPSGEREMSFLVLGQRKRGRLVAIHGVTTLASIEIRRGGKLSGVPVAMAICAAIEFDFECCVLPFWDMALRTFQPSVATLQRIRRRRMFLHREFRWLPALHRMTGRALSLVCAFGKLAFVCILVAVHALGEYQRLLEVAVRMALTAVDTRVLPFQRKLRFGVIKALID